MTLTSDDKAFALSLPTTGAIDRRAERRRLGMVCDAANGVDARIQGRGGDAARPDVNLTEGRAAWARALSVFSPGGAVLPGWRAGIDYRDVVGG